MNFIEPGATVLQAQLTNITEGAYYLQMKLLSWLTHDIFGKYKKNKRIGIFEPIIKRYRRDHAAKN